MNNTWLSACLLSLIASACVVVQSSSTNLHLLPGSVTTWAGAVGCKGRADGPRLTACLGRPMGIAVDASGNVYVTDATNMIIRQISPDGNVTTLAGATGSKGSSDGPAATARFGGPVGITPDSTGNLYVADAENHTIRKITPQGWVTTVAGLAGQQGSSDGRGTTARFSFPHGVAVDADGTLYVADTYNHVIRKIVPDGAVSTLAGLAGRKGSADGVGTAARFYHPYGIVADGQGTVYVADNGSHTIRKITATGEVSTLAGTAGQAGNTDAAGAAARFVFPAGLALDEAGMLYVAEVGNSTIRKISPVGEVATVAGSSLQTGHVDGTGTAARFDGPAGIAVDKNGVVFVADTNSGTIRVIR